ncbi:unnamed protein product [Camellia sinensis]
MLSDMSTFSVKEQERRLKVAMAEEEKVLQEAERVVNWMRQASARLDVSTINKILKEEGNQPTKLEYIVAYDNLLKGSLPDSIANLSTHISYISIGANQFHGRIPSGIGNLFNLTVLDIVMSYLTGPIPANIGKLSKLQGLYLQGNNFIGLPSSLVSSSF